MSKRNNNSERPKKKTRLIRRFWFWLRRNVYLLWHGTKLWCKRLWRGAPGSRSDATFRVLLNMLFWLCVIAPAFAGFMKAKIEKTHTGLFRIIDFADAQLFLCQLVGGLLLSLILFILRKVYRPAYKSFARAAADDFFASFMNFGWLLILAGVVTLGSKESSWENSLLLISEGVISLCIYIRQVPASEQVKKSNVSKGESTEKEAPQSPESTKKISHGLPRVQDYHIPSALVCPTDWGSAYKPLKYFKGEVERLDLEPVPARPFRASLTDSRIKNAMDVSF